MPGYEKLVVANETETLLFGYSIETFPDCSKVDRPERRGTMSRFVAVPLPVFDR